MDAQKALDVAMSAAQKAGERIERGFQEVLTISAKTEYSDRVTQIDKECQAIVESKIQEYFPEHRIIGEESDDTSMDDTGGYRWIVDPLDGTNNFIQHLPNVGVSIALQQEGQTLLGVLHFPLLKTTYSAVHDEGAYCGGKRLQVLPCGGMKHAFIAELFSHRHRGKTFSFPCCMAYRQFGLPTLPLAYVADGSIHGAVFRGLLWDYAAGELIVREAGGVITSRTLQDVRGNDYTEGVASVPDIHQELCDFVFHAL